VVVPEALAVSMRSSSSDRAADLDEQAACLGIAGITAHRAIFADGSVRGLVVLVHGAVGGVGSIAMQLALADGATVIGLVRDENQCATAEALGAHDVLLSDADDLVPRIKTFAPDGVHRIAEVDLAAHADLDAEVLAIGGVISSYSSSADRPEVPYWALGFKDTTLRLLGSDDFPPSVKATAAAALSDALVSGTLRSRIVARFALDEIAAAHELVERGASGRVVIEIVR
jgi:NADPH2:quinone reductase